MFESRDRVPPLTACVMLACVGIFLGLMMLGNKANYAETAKFGLFHDSAVWEGKPWALITLAFVHREIWHIFFNLYCLWILGGNLERDIGSLPWIAFVIAAAWVSSAAQLASGDMGIGFSGVGYAFFGFAWAAREKLRHTGPIVNESTVNTFLVWLVACIALTQFGILNVANEAHFGGLVFGCAVGWFYGKRKKAWIGAFATLLLFAISFVPLYYCPLSSSWTAIKAENAMKTDNYPQAIYWLKRTMAMDNDTRGIKKSWIWENLAKSYEKVGDVKAAAEAESEYERADKDND
jgi:membrane associated rhomboid family serine protease